MKRRGLVGWQGFPMPRERAEGLAKEIFSSRGAPQLQVDDNGNLLAVVDGTLVFEGDIALACIGQPRRVGHEAEPVQEMLRSLIALYRSEGEEFVKNLQGAFALALVDVGTGRTVLAIDRLGQQNLYYAQAEKGLVFGFHLSDVVAHPGIARRISHQALYDYVYYHHCPSPGTVFEGISKLEGGQLLIFQGGLQERKYYWEPQFADELPFSEEQAHRQLRELLEEAVRRSAMGEEVTGAFLSGGLDSSTVSGLLSTVYPESAMTFSIGFPEAGYDETEYARTAASHFRTRHHEFILQPGMAVEAVHEIAGHYDEPFGNSSALPALFCARLAADNGVKYMLAGDGGDELFAGNERYVTQLLFQRYERAPRMFRKVLEAGLGLLPEGLSRIKLFHKARRYVEQAKTPLPDRLQDYNFLHRHAAETVFEPEFLETVDVTEPLDLLRDVYGRPGQADALNRMLFMDWKTTLHDNDLVKVNQMCELGGVDVRYPMLDDEIVDFSMKIPSAVKLKGGRLRGFYKDAMRDFLPERIINKSKHGFGLPFGLWLSQHAELRELAYDSVKALKRRGYFRGEFLDHAVEMHRSVHASYYGELIWVLMMLELWFVAREVQ